MTTSQDAVMKGVASPLYIAQHLNLPNHHMFLSVVCPYVFIPNPKVIISLLILH